MQAIVRIFLSLKTAFWLFLLFVIVLFIGSLSLPNNLAFFSGIDEIPLFRWLAGTGSPATTWWIYALIALLALLATSTIFCTAEALLKRIGKRQLLLKLAPQIMHIGVLLIMLGHLLTASLGFKTDILVKQGERKAVSEKAFLDLKEVSVEKDLNGYDSDWEAKLLWTRDGNQREATIRPARPVYIGNYGLYVKSVTTDNGQSALLRVCRDPGAVWALIGGFILSLGGAGFLATRFRTP